MNECPFDWLPASAGCFHVSRWEGTHTDGCDSRFRRSNGALVLIDRPKSEDRSSLLTERVMFGKHRGTLWCDVPVEYCRWIVRNFKNNKSNRRTIACAKERIRSYRG